MKKKRNIIKLKSVTSKHFYFIKGKKIKNLKIKKFDPVIKKYSIYKKVNKS